MSGGPPMLPPVGPPAEVYIYVLPPAAGGRYSLFTYPRRAGDTTIAFTRQGNNPTPGKAREVVWATSGMRGGQIITIQEKGSSQIKGAFHGLPFTIHSSQPIKNSGPPLRGPSVGREGAWAYEVVLSDNTGTLARLDPEIIIIEDP